MAMIGELASAHPVQVLPHTPVFEAARLMSEFKIGDVIVTDEESGAVVGMVTDRDLVVRVMACSLDPHTTPIGDVCTTNVITITATDDVVVALTRMGDDAVRRLPVVNDDRTLAGVVSLADLAKSNYVTDEDFRDVLRAVGESRDHNRSA